MRDGGYWLCFALRGSGGYRHRSRLVATDDQNADCANCGHGGDRHQGEGEAAGLGLHGEVRAYRRIAESFAEVKR